MLPTVTARVLPFSSFFPASDAWASQRAFKSIHQVFREFDADNSGAWFLRVHSFATSPRPLPLSLPTRVFLFFFLLLPPLFLPLFLPRRRPGTIDRTELKACLEALGAKMSDSDVEEMFQGAKMAEDGALTFREFLLALCLGCVLQLFPALKAYSAVDLKKEMSEDTDNLDMLEAGSRSDTETAAASPATTPARGAAYAVEGGGAGPGAPGSGGRGAGSGGGGAAGAGGGVGVGAGTRRPGSGARTAGSGAAAAAGGGAAGAAGAAASGAPAGAVAGAGAGTGAGADSATEALVPAPPRRQGWVGGDDDATSGGGASGGGHGPPPAGGASVGARKPPVMLGGASAVAGGASPPPAALAPKIKSKGRELVIAMKLVLEAYTLFDEDGNGSIDRDEVIRILREHTNKVGKAGKRDQSSSAFLSEERWKQLDWDSDGQVTLREFVYAFYDWVGMEDEEDDDDES